MTAAALEPRPCAGFAFVFWIEQFGVIKQTLITFDYLILVKPKGRFGHDGWVKLHPPLHSCVLSRRCVAAVFFSQQEKGGVKSRGAADENRCEFPRCQQRTRLQRGWIQCHRKWRRFFQEGIGVEGSQLNSSFTSAPQARGCRGSEAVVGAIAPFPKTSAPTCRR